jgi:membrane protein
MFSVLKAFEVQNVLEPFLAQLLQPLGNAASEVTSKMINFVENIGVGILGAAGRLSCFVPLSPSFTSSFPIPRYGSVLR